MLFATRHVAFSAKNSDVSSVPLPASEQGRRGLREHDLAVALHGAFELGEELVFSAVLEAFQVADDHELAAAARVIQQ